TDLDRCFEHTNGPPKVTSTPFASWDSGQLTWLANQPFYCFQQSWRVPLIGEYWKSDGNDPVREVSSDGLPSDVSSAFPCRPYELLKTDGLSLTVLVSSACNEHAGPNYHIGMASHPISAVFLICVRRSRSGDSGYLF